MDEPVPPPDPAADPAAVTRARLAALPADKRAALEALLRRQRAAAPAAEAEPPTPAPRPGQGPAPLSFEQQRLWFLHQLDPRAPGMSLQIRGIFDVGVPLLEAALAGAVQRHEILRTCYRLEGAEPVQVLADTPPATLPVVDLSHVAEAALTDAALPHIEAERARPFDLARGPVWRAVAFTLAGGRSALCLTLHHIASDGWSADALIAELRERCAALAAGREPALPPMAIQYADYAAWQRGWLQGEVLERKLGWWRERLAGMPQVLDLRTDFPRPAVASGRGAAVSVALRPALVEGLRTLAQQQRLTPFMLLLALYQCVLARNTGQFDVVVGTPVAGRSRPEFEHVQGLFLNSLVLRTDLSGDLRFDEVLARVRDTVSSSFTHADLPFEKLVAALQPQRDLSRNPLFQALFTQPILDRYVEGVTRTDGESPRQLAQGQGEFDVGLWFEDYGGQATLSWHYAADLFLPATMERLARQFITLAEAVVADPGVRWEHVDLLSPEEHAALAAERAAAARPLPTEPFTRVVERQARRRPEATALVFEGRRVAYGELDAAANRLARHLRSLGAGRETRIAVHLERGIEMVVAVLAVLKAGASYVPMDPGYPTARLAAMLEDSGAVLRITSSALRDALPQAAARPVCVDAEAEAIAAHDGAPLADAPALADLAYTIYTSGSTGRPKGVMVEHGALANFLLAMAEAPGCSEADVLLAVTTLSFDIAGLELYLPLTQGATVVLVPSATAADGAALARLVATSGATVLQATPATWRLLLAAGWAGQPGLRMLCGGEALPRELADRLLARGAELWNVYGPTETTIWSAAGRVLPGRGPVPLGAAIANTQLHVLDRHLRPALPGAVGELAIGGAGVARGYWQRDELTAERFVPDPFAGGGARLYLTGDAVRRLADGTLEFIGRNDGQVKLRGFRIELGEIESVLARAPGVAEAVVLLREDRPGDAMLVAYVVPAAGTTPDVAALRRHAAESLPVHMVPTAWVTLAALPLTANAKVDRKALPPPGRGSTTAAERPPPADALERRIAAVWCEVLGVNSVGRDDNFFDLGGHSLGLVRVQAGLAAALGIELPVVDLFAHPSVAALAQHLAAQMPAADAPGPGRGRRLGAGRRQGAAASTAIAVVGLHGRFPGAADVAAFWQMLDEGREGIRRFSAEELIAEGHDPALVQHPDYVPAKGVAPDADRFDAGFFGYAPAEAAMLDPQQRVFLEHAWAALEDAGIDPRQHAGTIGVWASASLNSYSLHDALAGGDAGAMFLNDKDFVATRAAYKLGLQGPAITVQTACSSSLVAIAEACEALLARRCDAALAGGVSISAPLASGHLWQEGGVASRDGHCRAFDAAASGCVSGDGCGVVVLKRLDDALADGDTVRAVVRGWAVNNDGAAKAGFTAPSVSGQSEAIATALAMADAEPATIGYVEAHGTGTILGDPIEIASLAQAFGELPAGHCAIGSVKTNIGHLDAAAGAAGFVKAVLCLQHGRLPPSLNHAEPNPKIGFERTPFRVVTEASDWPASAAPRRAGVSAFGIGGTNAHVVLEEAPPASPAEAAAAPQLLVLSARNAEALDEAAARLAAHLQAHPQLPLADVARTLQQGRRAFGQRRFAVCRSTADAALAFGDDAARRCTSAAAPADGSAPAVAFLFSGQGAQHPGMGRALYESFPAFRDEVDRCAALLQPHLGADIRTLMWPAVSDDTAAARLAETQYSQPALFVLEYALARLWRAFGVQPRALLGHSLGEYVAATLAGTWELADGLRIVALRGRLMQAQPPGAMVGVPLDAEALAPFMAPALALAASNAPGLSVVAGPAEAIATLEAALAAAGHAAKRLQTSHAFHSPLMAGAAEPLRQALAAVPLRPPALRWVSNVTGEWITDDEATDPAYWARHLLAPVRFGDGLRTVLAEAGLLVEVGPGQTLATFARMARAPQAVASLPAPRDDTPADEALLAALGRVWAAGVPVDWDALHAGAPRRRVPLPTYAFERTRHWLPKRAARSTAPSAVNKRADIGSWLYRPAWVSAPAVAADTVAGVWLAFVHAGGLADDAVAALRAQGARVLRVLPGERLREAGADSFTLDPADPAGYRKLLDALAEAGTPATRLLHAWGLPEGAAAEGSLDLGWYSVLYLAQAVAARAGNAPPPLDVLTAGAQAVTGSERLRPEAAPVAALVQVLPQELPGWACRTIDLPAGADSADAAWLLQALQGELAQPAARERCVALRPRRRWLQRHEPLAAAAQPAPRWREHAVVVITGGLGNVGLAMAAHLAQAAKARLVLVGRSAFPAPEAWEAWLSGHPPQDATSQRIRRLQALQAAGAEVMVARADVADPAAVQALAAAVRQRFGAVHGVIHGAGLLEGESMAAFTQLGRGACEAQFRPKLQGLRVLAAAFDGPGLDFFWPVSSISTVLGGYGMAAYASANAFMDAFARERQAAGGTHWCSVAWDAWRFDDGSTVARAGTLAALALRADEGARVLDLVLDHARAATGEPQIVVSTADLAARQARLAAGAEPAEEAAAAPAHARPALAASYVEPRSEVERAIAEVWQELLGIERVGIYDNFFDLGGHSLLAVRAAAKLREKLGVDITLERFLQAGTIDQVAWQTMGQFAASLQAAAGAAASAPAADTTEPADAPALPAPPAAAPLPTAIAPEPFFFGPPGRRLFGLLRRAPRPTGRAVLLCPPHAHEYVRCHRALRELAVQLAAAGCDVMSFDLHGSGDSAGEYADATLDGWRDDVAAALDTLSARSGSTRLRVAGLRLGASLALQAAAGRDDVEAVYAWDPVVAGADLAAERAEIAALQALSPHEQQDVRHSDVLAFPEPPLLGAALARLDLAAALAPGLAPMFVLETGQEAGGRRLVERAGALGLAATHRRVDEARVWTREPYEAVAAREATAAMLGWITAPLPVPALP